MALRGHVFTKQLFSSDCFALFIDTFLGGESGIINGCTLENTTEKITLNKGYFLAKGRFLEEEEGIDFSIDATAEGEKFCKLICEIDLSQENTTSILNQAYYKIIEDDNDYPELQQDDITTDPTGIYQFEFCQFKRTTEGISEFRDTRIFVDFNSIYSEVRRNMSYVFEDEKGKFDTWFTSFKNTSSTSFNTWIETTQESFDDWFNSIKDILDENTASHLLNMILDLKKTQIIVSEEEPEEDCIWYKVLRTREETDGEYIIQTEPYDETAKIKDENEMSDGEIIAVEI